MATRRIITPAILLMTRDMGESDLLVELFTRRSGVVVGIAKGAKKSRKRFVNTFDTANLITVKFYRPKGRELFLIEDASLMNPFPHLSRSIILLAYGEFTLELLREFAPEGESHADLFDGVSSFLSAVDEMGAKNERWNGSSIPSVEGLFWSYTLKFLKRLGINPLFDQCVRCGKRLNDNTSENGTDLFIPSAGGMVCKRCLLTREGGVPFSRGTIMALAKVADAPMEAAGRPSALKFTLSSLKEIRKGLLAFIRYQAGRSLKSADFIERYIGID